MSNHQSLTDAECSRWIAEKLEPWVVQDADMLERYNKGDQSIGIPKCWTMPPTGQFKPRDMVSDPQMTVMLLEKLMDLTVNPLVALTRYSHVDTNWNKTGYNILHVKAPKDRFGRAVAEAFMMANGYDR